jgi:hypothetical protein
MSTLLIAMTEINYQEMYNQLAVQLHELFEERVELEVRLGDISKKIESLNQTMAHLGPLAGFGVSPSASIAYLGITDAVRAVLDPIKKMSSAEVKTEMEKRGYDFSKYSAPDASVRTILKRLIEAGKAQAEKEGYKVFYKYLPTDDEVPF